MSGIARFSLPLARPLATAEGTIDRREGFLVRIGDDPPGLGEATPLPGWTEPVEACRDALESVLSADELPVSPADLPDLPEAPAARHGLELAMLDRAAKEAGVPLYRHIGGPRRVSTVPVNATVGGGEVDETVEACRAAVLARYRTIKVKVGTRAVDADLDRLGAVREAVGPDVELRTDANGAWSEDEAADAIAGLGELGVALVEQPLEPSALSEIAALRGRGVDIAVDESIRNHAVDEVLDAEAADVIVCKPMVLGGIGRAKRAADRAHDRGVDVIVTTTIDAAVARTAAVHLAAAIDVDQACGLATADRLAGDVAADPAPVVDGGISVPQAAGNGVHAEDLD